MLFGWKMYLDALIAALGDDYQAGNFSDGYTFGTFAHVGSVWMWLDLLYLRVSWVVEEPL